jgi:peptide deformylase
MNRPVLLYPNATLRLVSTPYDPSELSDPDFGKLVSDLKETLSYARGAAISAVQVGVPRRLIVVAEEIANGGPTVFVNPSITIASAWHDAVEGCLSLPRIMVKVSVPAFLAITALGQDGEPLEVSATGDYAQALAHELEHLDGRLLVDKAKSVKREMIKRRMGKQEGRAILYGSAR